MIVIILLIRSKVMYVVQQKIGQGSQGTVYRGEVYEDGSERNHPLSSYKYKQVAIKKIPVPHTRREHDRIENEIQILSLMPKSAPMSIHLLDRYKEFACHCLVTELLDGTPLTSSTNRSSEADVRHMIRQVLRFVALCHSHGIAHRDIKPENFILLKDNTVKGIDFGMSTLTNEQGLCQGGVGTPLYMSPESIHTAESGELIDGFKSDMWSVGVIAYQLLTGKHPYDDTRAIYKNLHDFPDRMKMIPWDVLESSGTYTSQSIHFLRNLLSMNPSTRYSVFEALCDPWLLEDDTYRNGGFFLYLDHCH